MKKSLFLLTLVGFLAVQAYGTPTNDRKTKAPKNNWEQQLAKYISYPDVLQQTRKGGVVVIQFRVNAENELCQIEVLSQDEQLNAGLIRQLTGKKVANVAADPGEVHTVRLRFLPV